MNLVASMIVAPVEVDRYLYPAVRHLLTFCDRVMLVSDGREAQFDLTKWGNDADRVAIWWLDGGTFYQHEGRARQKLLTLTQELEPTHVLAIDADEFVADGASLRAACESECPVLTLSMVEVWQARRDVLRSREDGGWATHPVPIVWRAPDRLTDEWRIRDQALSSGREPEAVRSFMRQDCVEPTGVEILHFGWANEDDRQRRYDRYMRHDNGRYHNRGHLDSILYRDDRTILVERQWPKELRAYSKGILAVANP